MDFLNPSRDPLLPRASIRKNKNKTDILFDLPVSVKIILIWQNVYGQKWTEKPFFILLLPRAENQPKVPIEIQNNIRG